MRKFFSMALVQLKRHPILAIPKSVMIFFVLNVVISIKTGKFVSFYGSFLGVVFMFIAFSIDVWFYSKKDK